LNPSPIESLERSVTAQEGVIAQVRKELQGSRKRSHWIWFILPQVVGLGFSGTSRFMRSIPCPRRERTERAVSKFP